MTWILRNNSFKQSPLDAEIIACTKKDVIILSIKKLGLFWGLAIISILIPILHFVLVPAFLLAGVYAFSSQFKNTHHLTKGGGTCPGCNKFFSIKNINFFEGKKISCELCMEQLAIEKAVTGIPKS